MIDIQLIKSYFPVELHENLAMRKYMLKEYVQLLILDFLSSSLLIEKTTFIGGTNLRLVKGIDRFSEDLDFDCKNLSPDEFLQMTDEVIYFLQRAGFRVETRDKKSEKLKAFRRSIYFPELLFDLNLSAYSEERFFMKMEAQDQRFDYKPVVTNVKRMGFFFPVSVPPDDVLCAMKISALLSRKKGRDFYDVMFLLGQTKPDYNYLSVKCNFTSREELMPALLHLAATVDLPFKAQDFTHLLFHKEKFRKILLFGDFINAHL